MSYYGDSFNRTHSIYEVLCQHDSLVKSEIIIFTAGRLMRRRLMGKALFFDIQDISGVIQCYAKENELGNDIFEMLIKIQIGSIIGVKGKGFVTKTNQKSIHIVFYELLTPIHQELPEKFHGLQNVEKRSRQRYLDLIMNQETRDVFYIRGLILQSIRGYLVEKGFIEVETPILQKNPCGASANPFITYHKAKDIPLYLRISPEIFLKILIIAGYDKVFELGKSFRNEGISPAHLQEFTMLEFYIAYWSYRENIVFTRTLIKYLIEIAVGSLKVSYQNTIFDFSGEWPCISFKQLIYDAIEIDILCFETKEALVQELIEKGITEQEVLSAPSLGVMVDRLYKKYVRPSLIQPTIMVQPPAYMLPLARINDDDPRVVDAFQIIVNGWEIVKAYSELGDPSIQRKLLEEQARLRLEGDDEAMFLDEDFLLALEYGMPPVSGVGIGVDRLITLLTGQNNLSDVIYFPLLR